MTSLWLLTFALAATPSVAAVGLNDEVHAGKLTGIAGESVQVQVDGDEPRMLSVNDLRALQFPDVEPPSPFADPPAVTVLLIDGTELAASDVQSQTDRVRVTVEDLGELTLPLAALRAVRLGDPEKVAARWAELLQRDNPSDLLVRRKQDVLDFVEGALGDIGPQELSFLLSDRPYTIPRERVFGIIYAARATSPARPTAEVRVGRNRIQVRELSVAEGTCRGTLAATPVPVVLPLDRIHLIEFAGRVRFLGDLEPALTLPEGALPEERHRFFRRGSEPFGGPLRIGSDEVIAREGLWLHSGVTARYRINRDYRRLMALVGMDHNVGGNRAVRLVITGDGRPLFNEVIEYAQPAREIDLDVAGVRDLELRVERLPESLTQNLFGVQEHLDLGHIRLIR